MTPEYKEKLGKGLEYQDFVADELYKIGLPIFNYASKKYQITHGENKLGIEIKFDDKFKDTGNLFIEVAEKSNASNENFIASGICRNDNCWLYVIGDYKNIFIFSKKLLVQLWKLEKYRPVEIPTSKGFLLPPADSKKYAAKIIVIK